MPERYANAISSPLPRFWRRWKCEASALLLAAGFAGAALAQPASEECQQGLLKRFDRLVQIYIDAGAKAIEHAEPGDALDKARQAAIKGEAAATVTMIGVQLAMRGRQDMFTVAIIRQICTYAERNGLLLHVVSCAYFAALNPLGEREGKRRIVEAELARFDRTRDSSAPGGEASRAMLAEQAEALKACLRPAP
jgi:hypothetical protein